MTMEPYNWTEYLKYFAGLIAIVNPVGAVPLFVNMTVQQTACRKNIPVWLPLLRPVLFCWWCC